MMGGLQRGVMIALVLAVALFGWIAFSGWLSQGETESGVGEAAIGGPFTLTDQDGRPVTDRDFRGRLMLVYFGFTSCPDICPTGLQTIAQALDELGDSAAAVAPILITVDPERDTPEALKEYVVSFHESLIGLTGSPEQIAQAAKAYRVYYQKVKLKDSSLDYSVDHSGFIYLMGRDGKYLAHFRHNTTPEEMSRRIRAKL